MTGHLENELIPLGWYMLFCALDGCWQLASNETSKIFLHGKRLIKTV
jgi:hypothetical protein